MVTEELMKRGLSERAACDASGIRRSTFQYQSQRSDGGDQLLRKELRQLSSKHRRYGYRRVWALLRRAGQKVNHKRVYRIWKNEGLCLPRKRPKRRRLGPVVQLPHLASHKNHVWTWDFVFDRTEADRLLKILIVLDEWSRECHRIRVGLNMDADGVIDTIEWLFQEHGSPQFIRSDNGPEFIARKIQEWLQAKGATTVYIHPGHPWENPYAESFIGKLRDECLNEQVFRDERETQWLVEKWRKEYNEFRPHSSLGYKTPAEMALCSVEPGSTKIEVRSKSIDKNGDAN
jgi:putative transposase